MWAQQLFEASVRAQQKREAQRRRLESYGWVDRARGLVHIPIDRAMDLALGGALPQGPTLTRAQLAGVKP